MPLETLFFISNFANSPFPPKYVRQKRNLVSFRRLGDVVDSYTSRNHGKRKVKEGRGKEKDGKRTLSNGGNAVSVLIWNFDSELLCRSGQRVGQFRSQGKRGRVSEFLTLDSHDNLDSIKRVKSEIVGESSSSGDLQHQTVLISNPNILDLF